MPQHIKCLFVSCCLFLTVLKGLFDFLHFLKQSSVDCYARKASLAEFISIMPA